MNNGNERLRQQIIEQMEQYFAEAFPPMEFTSGVTSVSVSGKVIDAADVSSIVESTLDASFTKGRFAEVLERKIARFVGVHCDFW